jgi:NAD(P)-dependent dehydrogenase (short-subunit alcohol dehydrogenase family)
MWRRGVSPEEAERRLASGEVGQPEDLAPLVVFLASDEGGSLTGMTFMRDLFMPR